MSFLENNIHKRAFFDRTNGKSCKMWHFKIVMKSSGEFLNTSFVLIICFTSYFFLSTAVLPHIPGVILPSIVEMRDQNFPGLPPFLFEKESGIFLESCQPGTFRLAYECSTTELNLLLYNMPLLWGPHVESPVCTN